MGRRALTSSSHFPLTDNEIHIRTKLSLAYLAPEVLKRLIYKRDVAAVTVMQLTECALLSWKEQEVWVFGEVR
jgi:hypothetical protein